MIRIALHYNEHGEFDGVTSDEPIELYSISESAPNDRVYKFSPDFVTTAPGAVERLIGDDWVGFLDDGKSDALYDALIPNKN